MDLRFTDEQEHLVDAFRAFYATHASMDRVRAAEPLGYDKALWERLLEIGVIPMAVSEHHGGWGAGLLDLVLVAEEHGRAVAAAPLIEAQVGARLLERLGSPSLEAVLAGERLVTFGLQPAAGDRALSVPSGAVADDAIVYSGGELVLVPLEGSRMVFENLGSMPLADVVVNGGDVLATGGEARGAFEAAIDDWLVLTAGTMVGIGVRSLEIGVEYVKERRAFGAPIGSFQAISHPLADSAAALDGARLLTYEAAWSAVEDPAHARQLAALAFAFSTEVARAASYRSLHAHGGYGFMVEYDIQLYWRRARAWGAVWGEPATAYRRAADARYGRQ